MAFGYTLLLTENVGNEQRRRWFGYDTGPGGMLLHMKLEQKALDGNPNDFKITDHEIFLPGDQLAGMGSIAWTTLLDEDLGHNTRRVTRAYATPSGHVLIHRTTHVTFAWGRSTRTLYTDETTYIVAQASLAGTDITKTTGVGGDTWNYLTTKQPTGVTAPAECVYAFDGTGAQLSDRTGNGHTLVKQLGTQVNIASPGSFVGLGFDDLTRYDAPYHANLNVLGAITAEQLFVRAVTSGSLDTCWGFGGDPSTGLQADNRTWQGFMAAFNAKFGWIHEAGSGADDIVTFNAYPPVGIINHIVYTRSAANPGVIRVYQNGVLVGGPTAAAALPDGGTGGVLFVGREVGAATTNRFTGIIHSLKMTPEEFTAAQVYEGHQRVRGLIAA